MTPDEFVARSIDIQIGANRSGFVQSEAALLRALQASSGRALGCRPGSDQMLRLGPEGQLIPLDLGSHDPGPKALAAFAEVQSFAPGLGYVIDMMDRRLRRTSDAGVPPYPVFSFNRVAGEPGRVLWPLPSYHDIEGGRFVSAVDPEAVGWAEKRGQVIWRGVAGGREIGSGTAGGEGLRLRGMLKRYRKGQMSLAELLERMLRLPRYRALMTVSGDARFDFGFVDGDDIILTQTPGHAELQRPRVSEAEMQGCRYIAVLRGLDVGSSFYWVMNSGSVGFVMETPFETFASPHFHPWEHYIPFRDDSADLAERFEWAEAHHDECQAMAQRARQLCQLLARPDLRDQVLAGLVARIRSLLAR